MRRWRKRFAAKGLAALEDRLRPSRSRRYGPDVHLAIVATVTSDRPTTDSQWTHWAIAHHLASTGISASQVGRIPAALDLKPHVRGWLTRPEDPDFSAKAAEVCTLYLHRPPSSMIAVEHGSGRLDSCRRAASARSRAARAVLPSRHL